MDEAEAACHRLLTRVPERRLPRSDVTLTELLVRHLAMLNAGDTTRSSYRWTVAKYVDPVLGRRSGSAQP